MEKLEMRARARAAARAAGLFDLALRPRGEARPEVRGRTSPDRRPRPASTAVPIDEAQARAACAPMGALETIVQAADANGRIRTLYVIVPDFAMKLHYERLGFALEPGCRALLDAASLLPIAMLRLSHSAPVPDEPRPSAGGFNPYFDLPAT
jgi:hypothetical protein